MLFIQCYIATTEGGALSKPILRCRQASRSRLLVTWLEEETLIAGPHAAWQIDHAVRRQFRVSGQDVSVQRGRNSADSPAVSVVEEHLDTLFGECFAEGGIGFPIGGEDVTPNDRRSARVDNLQRPTGLCRDANDVDGQRHAVLDNVPAKGRFISSGCGPDCMDACYWNPALPTTSSVPNAKTEARGAD